MAKKNRIGLFLLLLATGFMAVGEASARGDAGVPMPGPKQVACSFIGCPDETLENCAETSMSIGIPGFGQVEVKIFCYEPERT